MGKKPNPNALRRSARPSRPEGEKRISFLSDEKLVFMVPTSTFVPIGPVPSSSHDKVVLVFIPLFFYTSKCVLSKDLKKKKKSVASPNCSA